MDVKSILHDYNVPYVTEGHKHARKGWINTVCPFCTGHYGHHLGWNLHEEYFFCWRCGWHPPVKTISELTGLHIGRTYEVIKDYGIVNYTPQVRTNKKKFIKPITTKLTKQHKDYLKYKRGLKPNQIESIWKIESLTPVSKVDNIMYTYRIFIPFIWNAEMVSFDTRDITGKQSNKYQACPKERELIEHKKILYGNQEAWLDTGIIVEGPIDAWAIGPEASATSGIEFTHKQVHVIGTSFKKVAVWFDPEKQAQRQAKRLINILQGTYNVDAYNIYTPEGDPAFLHKKYKSKFKRIKKSITGK